MAHLINAIILKGEYNKDVAEKYELIPVELDFNLSMFFIDEYYNTYWQKKLNATGFLETNCRLTNKMVIYELMQRITKREEIKYATIVTAYVGGIGEQFANVYINDKNADLSIDTINKALKYLGVQKRGDFDEFDTIGLGRFRHNPDYLDKYRDLADELRG